MSEEREQEPIARLRCDTCGIIEERIAYSALPLRLNGCSPDDAALHTVRIEEYVW